MTTIRICDCEASDDKESGGAVIEWGWVDFNLEEKSISDPKSYLYSSEYITPLTRSLHHIGMDDTKGKPNFDNSLINDFADRDGISCWAAHSAEFESGWLNPTKHIICTYKSALRVWPDLKSHSNGAVFYWLLDQGKIQPDMSLALPAHRAGPDAYVTAWILKALFDAGIKGAEMVKWTREPALLPRCPLGKFRGKPWSEVEAGFLGWMLKQADMSEDFKFNAKRELDRRGASPSAQ